MPRSRRSSRESGDARSEAAGGTASGDGRLAQPARRLQALATSYPRYGYLLLHALLRQEGLVINRKRTYRLYYGMASRSGPDGASG